MNLETCHGVYSFSRHRSVAVPRVDGQVLTRGALHEEPKAKPQWTG